MESGVQRETNASVCSVEQRRSATRVLECKPCTYDERRNIRILIRDKCTNELVSSTLPYGCINNGDIVVATRQKPASKQASKQATLSIRSKNQYRKREVENLGACHAILIVCW
ncbi:hypothetical protein HZH68_015387 [Vespula germanica]|uniref:Uncharacterized protein n=1 Tax=Vespula germanica TaxID=30212 RepID=A0A834J5T4_VESGE|nr:hypothetical protein HZH68_015387 [Vespula germanica]